MKTIQFPSAMALVHRGKLKVLCAALVLTNH